MDRQFVRHVKGALASRIGVKFTERACGARKLYVADVPEMGICLRFEPLPGRDELVLGLAWPSADSMVGYADLRRFSSMDRPESGYWIDVRWLESVDRRFSSDARLDTHAFLPRSVDFDDVAAVLAGARLSLEQLASRFDYSTEKTQRLLQGYYLAHLEEITLALRRSLPDWSTLCRAGSLPAANVERACAHWEALLDCVVKEGVAEFVRLLHSLPRECLPVDPPQPR